MRAAEPARPFLAIWHVLFFPAIFEQSTDHRGQIGCGGALPGTQADEPEPALRETNVVCHRGVPARYPRRCRFPEVRPVRIRVDVFLLAVRSQGTCPHRRRTARVADHPAVNWVRGL